MRERDYNLELIRIVSCVMVIVIHVSNYYCRAFGRISAGEYGFSLFLNTFARVSVPCFFMISGALLLGREETIEKHKKRIWRFLTATFVWSLIYYVHNVCYMKTPVDLDEVIQTPTEPHLWYLYAMIPIYIVLPFLQAMFRGLDERLERGLLVGGFLVVTVGYLLSLRGEELYYDVPLFADRGYSYYFFAGYILYKCKESPAVNTQCLTGIFLGSSLVNMALTAYISVQSGDHYERLLEYGCPLTILAGASFFLLLLRAWDGNIRLQEAGKKRIDRISGCSFGIYLIHILFLDSYKKHFKAWDFPAYLIIPALTAGLLAVSFGCVYLLRRTKAGRKIT